MTKKASILLVSVVILGLGLTQVSPFRARFEAALHAGGHEFACG